MKKKVYYKLNRYKVAKVEVESVEQEQAVKILNRETDRFAKSEDTYYEKCSSLDEMYEETGFEPADDTPAPEEQMIRASEQNELKVRIQKAIEKLKPRQREMVLMIFFEEKTQAEVAEYYGITEAAVATAGVWSIVMGVFFAIAQKNEEKEKARKMIKNYVIGLVVIFAILVACPYLVKGIAALIAG